MKSFIFALVTITISIFVCFAGLEVVTRTAIDDGMQYDLEMWKYAIGHKQESDFPGGGHVHVPDTQGRLMGVDVSINAFGLRGEEVAKEKQSDRIRILMLGDSITFGWGVKQQETMAARLEAGLKAQFPDRDFEVLNAGVGNANAAMESAWYLAKGKALHPDLVILNYFINDAEPTPVRQGGWLKERSYAYVHFAGKIDTIARQFMGRVDWEQYYRDLYRDDAPGWIVAQDAITRLIEDTKREDVPFLLVQIPEIRRVDPYPFPGVAAKVADLAAKTGVPYLDLLPSVAGEAPDTLWVTVEDPHPNGKANDLFTKAILEKLIADRLISP